MLPVHRYTVGLPRRYIGLLICFIPLSLILYTYFGHLSALLSNQLAPPSHAIFSSSSSAPPLLDKSNDNVNLNLVLVSAFFPLARSKHSMVAYTDWLSRFLGQVTTPIYFYCPPSLESTIRLIRGDVGPITIDTRFQDAFQVPPLKGKEGEYEEMHGWDREKDHHSPELYAVWAGKAYLLSDALSQLEAVHGPGKVKYAFWSDAGSFRQAHAYSAWPSFERVQELWEEGGASPDPPNSKIFFPLQRLPPPSFSSWSESSGPIDADFTVGSFFGGSPSAVYWFEKAYYAYHDYYRSMNIFVGKDQTLFNSLIALFPDRFLGVFMGDPQAPAVVPSMKEKVKDESPAYIDYDITEHILGVCGNQWYYYQFFLASETERGVMSDFMVKNIGWKFWTSDWWKNVGNKVSGGEVKEKCRTTRIIKMRESLRRVWGEDWEPPKGTVQF
ncbi:proteophosphoglycan 5 [Pyrrhoderma noxium]|uniref:Proteophosphoglycan 5 n=1 Tax=Pyrrhoderma noxium TaxID=2282107 RepID=A0A286UTS1_9AGAM|nr:proteophosphoglycan 5 [Pyrrhoderma noxium]